MNRPLDNTKHLIEEAEARSIVFELLKEYASEIDLNYEDDELLTSLELFELLKRGTEFARRLGCDEPEVCAHVLARFEWVLRKRRNHLS